MTRSKHTISLEYSQEAPVQGGSQWYNPFQRNSYSARVQFPDGFVVVIALPQSARRFNTTYWDDRVLMNACLMHAARKSSGLMVDGGDAPAGATFEDHVERVRRLP